MASENSSSTARRNRLIAIAAGGITIPAIVLAFASGYLGEQWLWLRPAGELLLLAELVGLIVLERHQLFEPVHGTVDSIDANVVALRNELSLLSQRFDASGQLTFYANPSQTVRAIIRTMNEALARQQEAPQVLRWARLVDYGALSTDPELGAELSQLLAAIMDFQVWPGSPADSKNRLWSIRNILTFTNLESFEPFCEEILPLYVEHKPLNSESKLLIRVRSRAETVLTPNLVTDRDVIVTLEDDRAKHRWGFQFHGPHYVALFARWFDELWASIPDDYLAQSRSGINHKALDRIRKELGSAETGDDRRIA